MTNTVLEAIIGRNSANKLVEPGPSDDQTELMIKAGLRAPDHARLSPWRFLVIEGDARERLGDVFASVFKAQNPDATEEKLASLKKKPLRAPQIIIVICKHIEHPKVPMIEQDMSSAAAATHILLAAESFGFAGIWRTGSMAFDRNVCEALGLDSTETISGFLYIGTRDGTAKEIRHLDVNDFFQRW